MFSFLSQRLLTVLQLTRMALVFTAISNSLCSLILWSRSLVGEQGLVSDELTIWRALAVASMSAGLYGYGMSLNDIIDRRRDNLIAAHRPIPSGRIGLLGAHIVCVLLAALALGAGMTVVGFEESGLWGVLLLIWTALLITFYDFAGKYLVAPGLLTLGMIRFFHATIAAPRLPLLWHPLLLLNHVVIISALAYWWEAKRPTLTRAHWWVVLGGLALADALCIGLVAWRRADSENSLVDALWITPGLLLPAAATALFAALAIAIRINLGNTRRAGQTLMLYGLMWLIVYDAAFAAGYVNRLGGLLLLSFLPLSFLSVQIMRWWGKVLSLSQKPEFQRVR